MGRRMKMSPDQRDVMIMTELKKYPPNTMRQIGMLLQISHVSIFNRFKWLIDEGYVQHAENAPRGAARSKILTEKGFRYLRNVNNF